MTQDHEEVFTVEIFCDGKKSGEARHEPEPIATYVRVLRFPGDETGPGIYGWKTLEALEARSRNVINFDEDGNLIPDEDRVRPDSETAWRSAAVEQLPEVLAAQMPIFKSFQGRLPRMITELACPVCHSHFQRREELSNSLEKQLDAIYEKCSYYGMTSFPLALCTLLE